MRKHELYTDYHDHFEYFGNTESERIRKQGEKTIRHDWIIFDTVDDPFEDRPGEALQTWSVSTGKENENTDSPHRYQRIKKCTAEAQP